MQFSGVAMMRVLCGPVENSAGVVRSGRMTVRSFTNVHKLVYTLSFKQFHINCNIVKTTKLWFEGQNDFLIILKHVLTSYKKVSGTKVVSVFDRSYFKTNTGKNRVQLELSYDETVLWAILIQFWSTRELFLAKMTHKSPFLGLTVSRKISYNANQWLWTFKVQCGMKTKWIMKKIVFWTILIHFWPNKNRF